MNIIEIFEDCISRYGSNPMIMEKQNNEYLSLSYQDIYNKVKKFSIGLLALGIKPGDKVEFRYEDYSPAACELEILVSKQ